MSDDPSAREEGFYWVELGQNPPEIAYWERGEWWLAGDARPWQPDAVNVLSDKLVFRPRLTPVAGRVSRCGDELARTALYEASRAREIVTPPSAEAGRSYGTESGQGRGDQDQGEQ
jgi:hypothetical protein